MNVDVCSERLDIISLCTGGGGLDIGIELAIPSARSVCLVEREAFAVAHLVAAMEQGLLAPAPVWSDVRTFDGRRWRGCVDGVIGGIPCQPHSLAGRKQGSFDERDLWSDARRIFVQSGAWFILIENVGGMLAAGADEVAGAERVWRDLLKLGCSVEIGLFTAAEVGASHERERIFILGVADSRSERGEAWLSGSQRPSEEWLAREPFDSRNVVADSLGAGLEGCQSRESARSRDERSAIERSRRHVVNADRSRWQEAWPGPSFDTGEQSEPGRGVLVHAECPERGTDTGGRCERDRNDAGRTEAASRPGKSGAILGDTNFNELRRQSPTGEFAQLQHQYGAGQKYLFPPGPGDRENWQAALERAPELVPSFRRVADGLAARLDVGRVDRLRMLGNGVVPLQAAYAIRTLATRLAARGSAGAARLVRMMEAGT